MDEGVHNLTMIGIVYPSPWATMVGSIVGRTYRMQPYEICQATRQIGGQ